jgi:hypothetical protein
VVENILNELDQTSGRKKASIQMMLAAHTDSDTIKDATRKINDAYKHLMVSYG